jgi:hypothetical protein
MTESEFHTGLHRDTHCDALLSRSMLLPSTILREAHAQSLKVSLSVPAKHMREKHLESVQCSFGGMIGGNAENWNTRG